MSSNHRDLITQVTYRQAAILADLPVNAPKLLLSFLTQLRQPEVPREPVGSAAQDSAPTTCRSETVEWPERQELLAHLHVASGPAHTWNPRYPRHGQEASVVPRGPRLLLLQRLSPGLTGTGSHAVHKERQ